MNSINMNINKNVHMIPLWKSPIKLPVELPVGETLSGCYCKRVCQIGTLGTPQTQLAT